MSNLTIGIIIDGFHEDAITSIQSIMDHSGAGIALLINGKQEPLSLPISDRIRVFEAKQKLGWGNAANFLLENNERKYLALMDPSTTFTGDAAELVEAKLDEGYKGVGWRGGLINIEDEWRSVDDKGPGEVDVLFSYFMALDREFAKEIGANPSSKYYRNADMELSLALREGGARLYQMDLPLQQGRHHGYYDVDESYREKHSKDNYNRILKRFRGKNDILSPRR